MEKTDYHSQPPEFRTTDVTTTHYLRSHIINSRSHVIVNLITRTYLENPDVISCDVKLIRHVNKIKSKP